MSLGTMSETEQSPRLLVPLGPAIPVELAAFPETAELWPKLVRRARPDMLEQYGLPELVWRLSVQLERERRNGGRPDFEARARIWFRVAWKSSLTPGEAKKSQAEIPDPSREILQQWIPGHMEEPERVTMRCLTCGRKMRAQVDTKFSSCRKCRVAARRGQEAERVERQTGELPVGFRRCVVCREPFQPRRAEAMYCGKPRCKQKAWRNRQAESRGVTDKAVLEAATT